MTLRLSVLGFVMATVACGGTASSAGPGLGGDGSTGGSSSGGSSSGESSSGGVSTATNGQGGSSQATGANGSNTTAGGTSNHDQPECETYFDQIDKSCQSADDCELVQHQTDCCGSMLVMGIASSAVPDFSAVELYCAAKFPLCGCAPRGLALEDGVLVDFGSNDFAAECLEGQCRSHSTAATSACGPQLRCTASQYCHELIGGPAGSEPSYTCVPLGDCRDCACLEVVGCQCTQSDGAIQVNCAAP